MRGRTRFLINPAGSGGVCSSPGLLLVVLTVGLPSLLLTAAVCWLIYLAVSSFRRGQVARGTVLLGISLVPFLMFAARTLQASLAEREHKSCLVRLARTGPVAGYPDVLVVRTGLWANADAARFLSAGFREVIAIGGVPQGASEPVVDTFTLPQSAECREALDTWRAKGAPLQEFLASNLSRCINASRQESKGVPSPISAVYLLRGRYVTMKEGCKGSAPRELRIRDDKGDRLVDYFDDTYAEWPIFPLLVSLKGFVTQPPRLANLPDVEFVLRNVKGDGRP